MTRKQTHPSADAARIQSHLVTAVMLAALLSTLAAAPARASTPVPFGSPLFAFPGSTSNPASAVSAGFAMADRWLGEDPFDNPAVAAGLGGQVSGALLHVSRQDLRAANRNYDETPAFLDGSGFALGLFGRGRFGLTLYGYQPVLQEVDNAFSRGNGTPDPANPPGTVESQSIAREMRAGLALSAAVGTGRVGAALEWTRRDDHYEVHESSGSPESGTRVVDFSGDAFGFQAGATMVRGDTNTKGVRLGVAVRHQPALKADATLSEDLLAGSLDTTLSIEREAGWEYGTSARYTASPAVRVLASLGGRSAQTWQGFDLTAGSAWEWKVALEYHDARDPFTIRLGGGQQHQENVPEPRTDDLALGFGWHFAHVTTDFGLVHRTVVRSSGPNSFEDRIVFTVRTP